MTTHQRQFEAANVMSGVGGGADIAIRPAVLAASREKGLVYRLAADAAAVMLEDQPAFVAQWQAERVAARSHAAVFAVNAACLVPPAALDQGVGTTSAFRRRHEKAREDWWFWSDEEPAAAAYDGPLPFEPDRHRPRTAAQCHAAGRAR